MSPTVVVFGVGSELGSGPDICVGGRNPAWELPPFYPGLHVNHVSSSGLLLAFLYGVGVRICAWETYLRPLAVDCLSEFEFCSENFSISATLAPLYFQISENWA